MQGLSTPARGRREARVLIFPGCSGDIRKSLKYQGAASARAADAELLHPALEGRGLEPQELGGAARSAYLPAAALEHRDDVPPLGASRLRSDLAGPAIPVEPGEVPVGGSPGTSTAEICD